jgi:hypothetical protein
VIPGAICATCVFFSANPYSKPDRQGGQCRRHAPVFDRTEEGRMRSIWPLVWDDHWCGEHAIVETGEAG